MKSDFVVNVRIHAQSEVPGSFREPDLKHRITLADPTACFRYEITVEDPNHGESGRNEEYRPETSFGIRRDETRSSKNREHEQSSTGQEAGGGGQDSTEGNSVQKRIEELQKRAEQEAHFSSKSAKEDTDGLRVGLATKMIGEASKRLEAGQYGGKEAAVKADSRKDDLEQGIGRLKIQNQGSGSDYDKAGQSSSNVDSGRGSAVYSSGRRPPPDDQTLAQGKTSRICNADVSRLLLPAACRFTKVIDTILSGRDIVFHVTPSLSPVPCLLLAFSRTFQISIGSLFAYIIL